MEKDGNIPPHEGCYHCDLNKPNGNTNNNNNNNRRARRHVRGEPDVANNGWQYDKKPDVTDAQNVRNETDGGDDKDASAHLVVVHRVRLFLGKKQARRRTKLLQLAPIARDGKEYRYAIIGGDAEGWFHLTHKKGVTSLKLTQNLRDTTAKFTLLIEGRPLEVKVSTDEAEEEVGRKEEKEEIREGNSTETGRSQRDGKEAISVRSEGVLELLEIDNSISSSSSHSPSSPAVGRAHLLGGSKAANARATADRDGRSKVEGERVKVSGGGSGNDGETRKERFLLEVALYFH